MKMRALVLLALVACGGNPAQPQTPVAVPDAVRAAVAAPDREADDKALDEGRKPDQILAFYGVAPGMKVAEIGSAGGYTTELLARVVGPSGKVYGQNEPEMAEKFFGKEWSARLQKPVMANVVNYMHSTNEPLPPEAKDLDFVIVHLLYHDFYWLGTDRAKLNAAVLQALKPSGVYGIVDHSGRDGTGTKEVQTLHRIEEKEVIKDIESAGFKLSGEADFLRHPEDTRDWSTAPFPGNTKRGKSDRFVLKFVKP